MNFLNVDATYPGIEIKCELTVLNEYLGQIEAGIASVAKKRYFGIHPKL